MSTSRQPACLHPQRRETIGRATLAVLLAIGLFMAGVDLLSDTLNPAHVATANGPAAPSKQSAADRHSQFDWIRKLFVGPPKLSPEELYEQVAPSVVTIYVMDEKRERIGSGSGLFIDKSLLNKMYSSPENDERLRNSDGDDRIQGAYVLTNYHVIRPAIFAELALDNEDMGQVEYVVAEDEAADLALLFVTVPSHLSINGIPLAPNDPRVMTAVFAIGSPEGLSGTASEGKVSAYREIYGGDRWLQTTAPISPGSSGGPLLLADGSLAGVTTLTHREGQNLNFAVPASGVRTFFGNAAMWPRALSADTSIHLDEQAAFAEMNDAVNSKQVGDADRKEVATVVTAISDGWQALGKGPADDGDSLAHYQKIIAAALGTENMTLPYEFRYLMHYVVGKASLCAAAQTEPDRPEWVVRTVVQCARYRANDYAADARYHLDKTIELKPRFSPAYKQLYHHHRLGGHWADALITSNTLVRMMPRCAEALALRAECYRVLGQPTSARQDLEAATKLSPASEKLYDQLAHLLVESGEYDDAMDIYVESLLLDAPGLRDTLHYHLAIAYRTAGNVDKAITEFAKAKALGWSADACDSQIADCRQRQNAPAVESIASNVRALAHEPTVYVTKSGTKYHCEDCQHLSKSKLPIALSDAAGIYEPCSHCRPPIPETTDTDGVSVAVSQRSGPRD